MRSSSVFIIKSKNSKTFKKRLELSNSSKTICVPTESGETVKIHLKLDGDRPTWSTDKSKYKVGFQGSPIVVEKVVYPKTKLPALSSIRKAEEGDKFYYYLIDKRSKRVISSKIFKKKQKFSKKTSFKNFGIEFDKSIHEIIMQPIGNSVEIRYEQDRFGNNYVEVLQDKRLKMFLGLLLSLWILNKGYQAVKEYFKTEVTKIQIENKKEILKEREQIAKLLKDVTYPTDQVSESNDNRSLKSKSSVKKKSKKKGLYSKKKKTNKKLKKGRNKAAATKKSIAKAKSKPSLQDQLFSRTLVKGSTGRASSKASKSLRGSTAGTKSGKSYGGSGTIQGGFVKGTGSSFGTKLGKRGGSGGGVHKRGGNGVGGLGAGLTLNGKGAGVSGGLTREQINKVVRRNKKDISRCFETREQFSPGLSGKISMNFTINGLGKVSRAAAGASSIKDAALKNCLSRKISTWNFDKPVGGRIVKVSYPFNFNPQQGKL